MWTKRNYFIWFEISKENGRIISFPISLLVIKALFESILELIMVVSYLIPVRIKSTEGKEAVVGEVVRQVLDVLAKIIIILEYEHHLDLLVVESKEANVKIALR